jgi:hypothetical protein
VARRKRSANTPSCTGAACRVAEENSGRERRAQRRYRPWDAAGGHEWRDRSSPPPTPALPTPTRSQECVGFIASWAISCQEAHSGWREVRVAATPHARHDRGARLGWSQAGGAARVSPCKRVANTSAPWWMPVLRRQRLRQRGAVVVPPRVARCSRARGSRRCPDAGPATCARCRSVLSRLGTTRHVGAGGLCARSAA